MFGLALPASATIYPYNLVDFNIMFRSEIQDTLKFFNGRWQKPRVPVSFMVPVTYMNEVYLYICNVMLQLTMNAIMKTGDPFANSD